MSKHIQLAIPVPCHENWDNMSPVEKGRFCGSCQKQVVDFSNMSDREIAQFFKKPSKGSVCGRFMQDQLDRNIEIPKKRIPWLKYFFQFALPAFLISMKATAQGKVTIINQGKASICKKPLMGAIAISPTTIKPVIDTVPIIIAGTLIPGNRKEPKGQKAVQADSLYKSEIRGKVVDEKGEPVPNASIKVMNTGLTFSADSLGEFVIQLTMNYEKSEIEISSIGYQRKILSPYNFLGDNEEVIVQLDPDIKKLQDVIVNSPINIIRKGMVTGAYSVCKKTTLITEVKNRIFPSKDALKLYPNPIKSRSSLKIEWKQAEAGYYVLQILNSSGQLAFTKEMWIDKEARLLELELPSIPAGTYFLRMTSNKSGKNFTEKLIIE
jgi:hypothetical protein